MKKLMCLWLIFLFCAAPAYAAPDLEPFAGKGTKAEPYVISTAEDLAALAELVNGGEHFEDMCFVQAADIDLAGIEWTPIGEFGTENHFDGLYDGDGHCIENITITQGGNCGLFGQLGGTVMNLGIGSGEISGVCVGGISSHAGTGNARIINCYNKATIQGARAGGIADNFNGMIVGCWNVGALSGDATGPIVSFGAQYMSGCYDGLPTAEELNRELISVAASANVSYKDLNMWVETEEGPAFSAEKKGLSVRDIPAMLAARLPYIIPAVLALSVSACMIAAVVGAGRQRRREQTV